MNRKLFLSFACAVGLLGILGCSAQPPDPKEEPKTTPEAQLETTDQSEVSSESFESGQVEVEDEDAAEKPDPE